MKHSLALPALVALTGLILAACSTDTAPAPAGESPASGTTEAQATEPAVAGTASAPAAASREMGLLEKGRRRTVTLKEAAAGVPFALLEPKLLPKDSVRSVVHLIEKIDGIENPALPAVRQIFDLAGGGSLILVMSVARDDLGGEANTKVGDAAARMAVTGGQKVLTFERDGVQYELRSNQLSEDQLLEIAGTFAPVDLDQAGSVPASSEDMGAALSGADATAAVPTTAPQP